MTQLPVTVAATSAKAEVDTCFRMVISSAVQLQAACIWVSTSSDSTPVNIKIPRMKYHEAEMERMET